MLYEGAANPNTQKKTIQKRQERVKNIVPVSCLDNPEKSL